MEDGSILVIRGPCATSRGQQRTADPKPHAASLAKAVRPAAFRIARLRLGWNAPAESLPALEGGFSPREALASLPTSGAEAPRGLKPAFRFTNCVSEITDSPLRQSTKREALAWRRPDRSPAG